MEGLISVLLVIAMVIFVVILAMDLIERIRRARKK